MSARWEREQGHRQLTMVTPHEEMGKLWRPEALGPWRVKEGGGQGQRHVWRWDVVPDACFLVSMMGLWFLTYRLLQEPVVSLFPPLTHLHQPLVS